MINELIPTYGYKILNQGQFLQARPGLLHQGQLRTLRKVTKWDGPNQGAQMG